MSPDVTGPSGMPTPGTTAPAGSRPATVPGGKMPATDAVGKAPATGAGQRPAGATQTQPAGAPQSQAAGAAGADESPGVPRRRWHRSVIPFAVAALLFLVTGITYAIEEPDPADPDFLSPVSTAPIGAKRLADELRARGVTVQRETRTAAALTATFLGRATLFIPVPAAMRVEYLPLLAMVPSSTRVVLVDPPRHLLDRGRLPVTTAGRRWATRATAPGVPRCTLPEAVDAGVAAALRRRYSWPDDEMPVDRCYGDGLVRFRWNRAEFVVIGASDPFRNDRMDEHGNARLAAGLLDNRPRVVWLDLHTAEPPKGAHDQPVGGRGALPPPGTDADGVDGVGEPGTGGDRLGDSHRPGDGDRLGGGGRIGGGGRLGTGDRGGGDGGAGQSAAGGGHNPLWDAFPPWFWALLVQLALALLVFALWRARRLGPPVAEPLAVTVRGAETVLGRGRLYRRARARGPAAAVLRQAALYRILPLLDLPADAARDDVVTAVARMGKRDPGEIATLLYGPEPDSDRELLHLARALDSLPRLIGAPPLADSAASATGDPTPTSAPRAAPAAPTP